MAGQERAPLGPLENAVMQVLWKRNQATAEEVRTALQDRQDHKESTVRTILMRLETKGYVEHEVEGRTYVYRPRVFPAKVASTQVRGIIDRFCRGSVENLLVGMVDEKLISPEKLKELADRIAKVEIAEKSVRRRKNKK